MNGIDKQHPLPIYHQLKEMLRGKIRAGEWNPGDSVPSERELSETYDISRMTARQALKELTIEGLVYREQGRGTFVANPRLVQSLSRLTGFTEDMRERALRPGARVLQLKMTPASARAAKALKIDENMPIALLERLRLADGEPMAIERSHLHFDRVEEVLHENFENNSLYGSLTEKFGIIPTSAEQQIAADLCSQHRRATLKLDEGAPVLRTSRITYEQHGNPFEFAEAVYRGDRYIFHAEMTTLA